MPLHDGLDLAASPAQGETPARISDFAVILGYLVVLAACILVLAFVGAIGVYGIGWAARGGWQIGRWIFGG